MPFPTAEEITKVTVPASTKFQDALRSIVNEHLESQVRLIEEAASKGRFSVEIKPPSQEIINKLENLGYSEFDFHFGLREVVLSLGYRADTHVNAFCQPSTLYWYHRQKL